MDMAWDREIREGGTLNGHPISRNISTFLINTSAQYKSATTLELTTAATLGVCSVEGTISEELASVSRMGLQLLVVVSIGAISGDRGGSGTAGKKATAAASVAFSVGGLSMRQSRGVHWRVVGALELLKRIGSHLPYRYHYCSLHSK